MILIQYYGNLIILFEKIEVNFLSIERVKGIVELSEGVLQNC